MSTQQQTYLKIKIMSLAEEAIVIRNEENKWRKKAKKARDKQLNGYAENHESIYWGLRCHSEGIVRFENRAASLAYAYIRGKTYEQVEQNPGYMNYTQAFVYEPKFATSQRITKSDQLFLRVARLVQKYGPKLPNPRETNYKYNKPDGTTGTRKVWTREPEFQSLFEDLITWRNCHPKWKTPEIRPKLNSSFLTTQS